MCSISDLLLRFNCALLLLLCCASCASEEILSDRQIQAAQLQLHEAFEVDRLHRSRRSTIAEPRQHYKVIGVKNAPLGLENVQNVSVWQPVSYLGAQLLLVGTYHGTLQLWRWFGGKFVPYTISYRVLDGHPFKARSFVYMDQLWLACLEDSSVRTEEQVIRLYEISSSKSMREESVTIRQTITLGGIGDFDVVSVSADRHYLALSLFKSRTSTGVSYEGKIKLYEWKRTQYDVVSEYRSVVGARSVAVWSYEGSVFIASAQFIPKKLHSSAVFVYNGRYDPEMKYVQLFRMVEARQALYYTVQGLQYVVFLSKRGVSVHFYSGDQFLEWQTLRGTEDANVIRAFRLPSDEIVIAVLKQGNVLFYSQSSTSAFNLTATASLNSRTVNVAFLKIQGSYFGFPVLDQDIIRTNVTKPHTFQLILEKYFMMSSKRQDPLVQCLNQVEASLAQREPHIRQLRDNIGRVWRSDQPTSLATKMLIVDGNVNVQNVLETPTVTLKSNGKRVPKLNIDKVDHGITNVSKMLTAVDGELQHVVVKSIPQTIEGIIKFERHVIAKETKIDKLGNENAVINKIPLQRILRSTLKINRPQTFRHNVTIDGDVDAAFVNVGKYINGVNVSDLMLKNKNQHVNGHLKFNSVVIKGDVYIKAPATINGILPHHIVATNVPVNQIKGVKHFKELHSTRDVRVTHRLNGKDLKTFIQSLIHLSAPQRTINGHLTFESPLSAKHNLELKQPIAKVYDIGSLFKHGVTVEDEQHITGRVRFMAPVNIHGDLNVVGTINGIDLNRDLVTVHGDQTIRGSWTIKPPLRVDGNLNAALVNGIDLVREAVPVNVNKTVTIHAPKMFLRSINVLGSIGMSPGATIDGVDPSELSLGHGNRMVFKGPVTFKRLHVKGKTTARKGINGYAIADIPNLIWLKDSPQEISVPVTMKSVHVEGSLTVRGPINNLDLKSDLLRTHGHQEISAPVVFTDNVQTFSDIDVAPHTTINGAHLGRFARQIASANSNKPVLGRVTMKHLTVDGDIYIDRFNGLSLPNDFLRIHGNQTIKGVLRGRFITADHLLTTGLNVKHINGKPADIIKDMVLRTAPNRKPITNKMFVQGLKTNDLRVEGRVNGVNPRQFFQDVVTLHTPQTIVGAKRFNAPFKTPAILVERFNNVNISRFLSHVVQTDQINRVIRGRKTIRGKLVVRKNLQVLGPVNGLNTTYLYTMAMSKSRLNKMLYPIRFEGEVLKLSGGLSLNKGIPIDGVHLEHAIPLHGTWPIELKGFITFSNAVHSRGNIVVGGTINGCDLEKLKRNALYLRGDTQIMHTSLEVSRLIVHGNVDVAGSINGFNLTDLMNSLVNTHKFQTLTGPVTFIDAVSVEQITVNGLVNDKINVSKIFRDAVLKSKVQTISGAKHFMGAPMHAREQAVIKRNVNLTGTLGGFLPSLFKSVVTIHGVQVIGGKKILHNLNISGNVEARKTLNNIRVPADLVLQHRPVRIPGRTTLTGPTDVQGNLRVRKVDGVNMDWLLGNLILPNSNKPISAHFVFKKNVAVDGDVIVGKINGIPYGDVVKNYGSKLQHLKGPKTFMHDLEAQDAHVRYMNNELVDKLKDQVVSKGQPLPEAVTFMAPVTVDGDTEAGLVNNYALEQRDPRIIKVTQELYKNVGNLGSKIDNQASRLLSEYNLFQEQSSYFLYLEPFQTLKIASKRILISPIVTSSKYLYPRIPANFGVLWTSHHTRCRSHIGTEHCCDEYSSGIMTIETDGRWKKDENKLHRRYFPLIFPNGKGFLAWTNSTSTSKYCEHYGAEEFVVEAVEGTTRKLLNRRAIKINNASFIDDVRLFELESNLYMVLASTYSRGRPSTDGYIEIFKYDASGQFSKLQDIHVHRAASIDIVELPHKLLLSVAHRKQIGPTAKPSSIYTWDKSSKKFVFSTSIPTSLPSSTLFLHVETETLLCVIANEKAAIEEYDQTLVDAYTEPVVVYRDQGGLFEVIQHIPMYGVNTMARFQYAGESFLVLGSRHLQTISIYHWRGFAKFQLVHNIGVSPLSMATYWSSTEDLFLAVATECGSTRIFKAVWQRSNQCSTRGDPSSRKRPYSSSISRRMDEGSDEFDFSSSYSIDDVILHLNRTTDEIISIK